jgi:deoxyribodipyrimidine photo-lyase
MSNLKRGLSPAASPSSKRARTSPAFRPKKIATVDAAAAVDSDTPLSKLLKAVEDVGKKSKATESVVYWMRMGDLRSSFDSTVAHRPF